MKILALTSRKEKVYTEHLALKNNKTLVVIVGPTAVGKTSIALQLANHLNTEIISADSRQIFRELNIGTAKPTPAELAEVKHHFINTHSINQDYDAAQFGNDALLVIKTIFETNDYAILCGGSGLYVQGVCEGFDIIPEVPDEVREDLNLNFQTNGIEWLQQKMLQIDPEYFSTIDQQNPHRMIRALEVKIGTGKSISSFQNKEKLQHNFNIVKFGLELEREILYKRIDQRMDDMISQGLFQEAESLYPYRDKNALQTVGYQEIFDFLENKFDKDEAIRLLKRNSRRYAKRQLTWFKRDAEINWLSPLDFDRIIDQLSAEKKE